MFESIFRIRQTCLAFSLLLGAHTFSSATALTVPFTEDFEGGIASWQDVGTNPVNLVTTGGSDGGQYISVTEAVDMDTGTIFRCTGAAGCSGGAFVGDWAANVSEVSWDIMHNASEALEFFIRIATPANFPAWIGYTGGAVGVNLSVAPNTWTNLLVEIFDGAPALETEFGPFLTTFANVGNFQIAVSAPDGFDESVTFGLDQVSLAPAVPLPAAVWLFGSALIGLVGMRRKKAAEAT